ncbi:23S rRNA pseudouridine 955/2504/2580 synthase [Entomoplasma ellychniae]|uniref:RNA pseudouridylate synthase n=1 Tax=Entomoplasma ellychniae TaxID=2114 RepID=A0A8E2UAM1_9MOLU|nr:RluA family pseudouridine synthase [Entomoplasma ellychniae]PPE04666.1 23S rRNA pseudouridine 955/2504/2580 synthase [Entomoplasma ellychniae]
MNKFKANQNDKNQTIFKFLKKKYKDTPLSVIYKWLRVGDIKINDKRVKLKSYLIQENDEITVYDNNKPTKRDTFIKLTNYNLNVIFEDQNILIVEKPFNLEVHSPVATSLDDIVKSYLIDKNEYNPSQENSFVISHVHRLDKLTAGLIIYSKNKTAHSLLTQAIQEKDMIEKYYRCKIDIPVTETLIADGWIEYNPVLKKSVYTENEEFGFKKCKSVFNVVSLDVINETTELEVQIFTGKKHQIRATLEYYQAPILNDTRYSGTIVNDRKMIYLYSCKLVFQNMINELEYLNGKIIEITPAW